MSRLARLRTDLPPSDQRLTLSAIDVQFPISSENLHARLSRTVMVRRRLPAGRRARARILGAFIAALFLAAWFLVIWKSGRLAATVLRKKSTRWMPPGRSVEARCDASELRNRTRNSESGKEASMRRIGTPYSTSELRIRKRSFDASHRNSVFHLGASNPEKKLRCVPP